MALQDESINWLPAGFLQWPLTNYAPGIVPIAGSIDTPSRIDFMSVVLLFNDLDISAAATLGIWNPGEAVLYPMLCCSQIATGGAHGVMATNETPLYLPSLGEFYFALRVDCGSDVSESSMGATVVYSVPYPGPT